MAEPIATIKQGQLKGVRDTDLNGEEYYKFLGIPYAKPPLGPLRFKAPQPAEIWTGIRDATKEGSPCLALDFTQKLVGSEDCLYLNVFTKKLPKLGLSLKPVMVFIHGGAFTGGSSSEEMQGAKYLVAEDIVLVTLNYRLGILGFLSSDDLSLEVPGNAGLKDQTMALRWVQENIANFNGDPNNVTLFGISAGGASVHYQVLSPTAKGLFHKAIAQSGAAFNPWAWGQKNAIEVARKLGEKVANDKEALRVLVNVPAEELYQACLKITDNLLESQNRRPFGPVIEKRNPTAFLTENPSDLLASGRFNQVPLIQGVTSNEGLIYELPVFKNIKLKEIGVSWTLGIKTNNKLHAMLKDWINEFYFKEGETEDAIHELTGDVAFTIGVIESAKLAAKVSRSPVYFYVFSYDTIVSNALLLFFGNNKTYKGVTHGGDGLFLFNSNSPLANVILAKLDPKDQEEINVGIRKVTKIWTDFARTGRPHEQWEPVTNVNELKYFEISKEPQPKVNPFAKRVALWKKVLKEVAKFDARIQEKSSI